ncbi:hypothetical protein [Vibrio splendidus]|nr:hypothetical protein [Vibrio splendidus]|tara:strand:- start:706 stop:855 length:150 start_codon:yes stop_codon:yes gene_type:complete
MGGGLHEGGVDGSISDIRALVYVTRVVVDIVLVDIKAASVGLIPIFAFY